MLSQSFTVTGAALKLMKLGERGTVTKLKNASDETIQKLRAIGIYPGTTITLEQRFPRFVVKVGSTQRSALCEEMIQAIYVRISSVSPSTNPRMPDRRVTCKVVKPAII